MADDGTQSRTERTFAALRKARWRGGRERSPPSVYHAVTPHCRIALCAQEPGAGSSWAEPPGAEVTCQACLKRLELLARSNARVLMVRGGPE